MMKQTVTKMLMTAGVLVSLLGAGTLANAFEPSAGALTASAGSLTAAAAPAPVIGRVAAAPAVGTVAAAAAPAALAAAPAGTTTV